MQGRYAVSPSARGFSLKLAAIAALLTLLHVVMWWVYYTTPYLRGHEAWTSMFDLDTEQGFGTWFSAGILLIASILTLSVSARRSMREDAWNLWWWILGAWLMFLSIDEVAGIHESLNSEESFRAIWGLWTTAGLAIVVVLGIGFLPFMWRLPRRTRWWFVAASLVYFGGALGVERYTLRFERLNQLNTLPYDLWNGLEESMEMGGVIMYLYALLRYMADDKTGRARVEIEPRP